MAAKYRNYCPSARTLTPRPSLLRSSPPRPSPPQRPHPYSQLHISKTLKVIPPKIIIMASPSSHYHNSQAAGEPSPKPSEHQHSQTASEPSPEPSEHQDSQTASKPSPKTSERQHIPQHPTEMAIIEQNLFFPSRDAAYAFLWERAIENGHGIVIGRSRHRFPDSHSQTGHRRITYQCERSGKLGQNRKKNPNRPSPKKPRDTTSLAACGCPWRAVCHYSEPHWGVAILNDTHNHRPSRFPKMSNAYRRFKRRDDEGATGVKFLDKVANLAIAGQSSAQIASLLSTSEIPVLPNDIKTAKAALRHTTFGPRSATQAFLQELEVLQNNDKVFLRVQYHPETERIHRIFWAYEDCIQLFKENPELLLFDNTYKVNRFNMPLLQIGGLTGLHTNFSVAFALTSAEDEDSFLWALSQLREMAEHHNIPSSLVIVSDYDKAFKNAARKVFETSQQQLCVWHILKNVVHNIKQKWEGPLGDFAGGINENSRISGVSHYDDESNPNEEDSHIQAAIDRSLSAQEKTARATISADLTPEMMLEDFRAILYADDEPEFRKNWEDFQSRYKIQEG